ncbi:MAG: hypothetical protein AAFX06_25510 [Planctomycetota bacterium]
MKTSNQVIRVGVLALVTALPLSTGCVTTGKNDSNLNRFFKTPKWMSGSKNNTKPYPSPAKLAVTWTPDVLVQAGKTPTRGFGGRLFFFDEGSKAVPVEGTLTIHGFEAGADGEAKRVQPFKFTPEQFTEHFSESDFGASYSIWIPWDPAGGEQKRISLVATFQTTSGKFVQASPTTVLLPGSNADTDSVAGRAPIFSPQYQNHVAAVEHHATRPSGLVTTTIRRSQSGNSVESGGLSSSRIDAMLAKARGQSADGKKMNFADVPLNQSPTVLPASAIMPQGDAPQRIRRLTR